MKYLLKLAVVVLALSCFQAYGTSVCSSYDAFFEALDRWEGQVIEAIYDPDKKGYLVIMNDRRGREKIRFVAIDCGQITKPIPIQREYESIILPWPEHIQRANLIRQIEQFEQNSEELRPLAENLEQRAEEKENEQKAEILRQHAERIRQQAERYELWAEELRQQIEQD